MGHSDSYSSSRQLSMQIECSFTEMQVLGNTIHTFDERSDGRGSGRLVG